MRLKNRVAIVTGAGVGIGKAVALRYGAEGAQVLVAEIDAESGAPRHKRFMMREAKLFSSQPTWRRKQKCEPWWKQR